MRETYQTIWDGLNASLLKYLTSADDWNNIAGGMFNEWKFSNYLDAIDGKYIAIEYPAGS